MLTGDEAAQLNWLAGEKKQRNVGKGGEGRGVEWRGEGLQLSYLWGSRLAGLLAVGEKERERKKKKPLWIL